MQSFKSDSVLNEETSESTTLSSVINGTRVALIRAYRVEKEDPYTFFSNKNIFYTNMEAEICEILRIF